MSWDQHFMALAKQIARMSKDPSTKVGCVVVGSDREILASGFNGFPRRCSDHASIYADRARKHLRVVHAEANCVAAASRTGTCLKGASAFVTQPCCSQCAALLINAGVVRIVVPVGSALRDDWRASVTEGLTMMREAGVMHETLTTGEQT